MFARVTIAKFKPGVSNEITKIYQEGIDSLAESQKGFVKAYLLINSKENKVISVAFWESEEDAITNEQSGYYHEQMSKAKHLLASVPVREGYEVTVEKQSEK